MVRRPNPGVASPTRGNPSDGPDDPPQRGRKETMENQKSSKSGSVMVIGAGIAGMQASLDLANSDFKVYLVDKLPAVGGMMAQLDKTFPTNDCAM